MSICNNYAADPALAQLLATMKKEKSTGGSVRPQTREKKTIPNPSITQDRRKTEPGNTYAPISIAKPQAAFVMVLIGAGILFLGAYFRITKQPKFRVAALAR